MTWGLLKASLSGGQRHSWRCELDCPANTPLLPERLIVVKLFSQ